MPNLDCLIEQVVEIINEQGEGEVLLTSYDINYACRQTDLLPENSCNKRLP